jgi:adenylate cyclase
VAEVELADEADSPQLPPWVGPEVSADERYFNSFLAGSPYSKWQPLAESRSRN